MTNQVQTATTQATAPRSIFRQAAMQAYIEQYNDVVQPQLISPAVFRTLWLVVVVLVVALAAVGAPLLLA